MQDLSESLLGERIILSDVVAIPNHADLFRAKVPDDEQRKRLLDKAKELKHSERYKTVFIRRDLTYAQRQELMARRQIRASAAASQGDGAAPQGRAAAPVQGPALPVEGAAASLVVPNSQQQVTADVQSSN